MLVFSKGTRQCVAHMCLRARARESESEQGAGARACCRKGVHLQIRRLCLCFKKKGGGLETFRPVCSVSEYAVKACLCGFSRNHFTSLATALHTQKHTCMFENVRLCNICILPHMHT